VLLLQFLVLVGCGSMWLGAFSLSLTTAGKANYSKASSSYLLQQAASRAFKICGPGPSNQQLLKRLSEGFRVKMRMPILAVLTS
jgi:hypothetical protein